MEKKCKHTWVFMEKARIGKNPIAIYNPYYAVFVCPYCGKRKRVKFAEACSKW